MSHIIMVFCLKKKIYAIAAKRRENGEKLYVKLYKHELIFPLTFFNFNFG